MVLTLVRKVAFEGEKEEEGCAANYSDSACVRASQNVGTISVTSLFGGRGLVTSRFKGRGLACGGKRVRSCVRSLLFSLPTCCLKIYNSEMDRKVVIRLRIEQLRT